MKSVLLIVCVLFCSGAALAQTFEINGQPSQPASSSSSTAQRQKNGQQQGSGAGETGAGRTGKQHRSRPPGAVPPRMRLAAGNSALAADYAERAVKAAPQDNKLWFLLGYTARLQVAIRPRWKRLPTWPANRSRKADGLSGLAQTYEKMGRTDDAKRLLLEVIRTNPNRINDLLIAGELYMRTGDTQEGINLLQRAESQQPNAHAELMLAVAYLKLKQPDRARQMLDQAKKHAPGNVEIFQAAAITTESTTTRPRSLL